MAPVLIVGASRGLGAELAKKYAAKGNKVLATSRSTTHEDTDNITYIPNIDISKQNAGETLAELVKPHGPVSTVIITAGYFGKESFDEPDWEGQVRMYTTSSIGPVFVVHHLVKNGLLEKGSKVILVSSESGSITLRHESEGGGNFGHHASKSALNMVGKLLSLDLKDKGIAIGIVHISQVVLPGFMRTEMTKSVGFDKFWDDGGAVTPDVAADSLLDWTEKFDIASTGEYWAPRGPRDIGTAEPILGKDLSTPLQLPW